MVCHRPAKPDSVYCSDECIVKQANKTTLQQKGQQQSLNPVQMPKSMPRAVPQEPQQDKIQSKRKFGVNKQMVTTTAPQTNSEAVENRDADIEIDNNGPVPVAMVETPVTKRISKPNRVQAPKKAWQFYANTSDYKKVRRGLRSGSGTKAEELFNRLPEADKEVMHIRMK